MQITSLEISNFRAIRYLKMDDLSSLVVVAGTNGCGKSSVFNAIRLLKSAYGEYHQNEWHQWFAEFQIDINQLALDVTSVLNRLDQPLRIIATFEIAESERNFLQNNGRAIIERRNWQRTLGRFVDPVDGNVSVVAPQDRARFSDQVNEQTNQMFSEFERNLSDNRFVAELTMTGNGQIEIQPSPVMELILGSFMPEHVGIIDYHGSHRVYGRQTLNSINLKIAPERQSASQHALYNTQNKYGNIKTQMASEYVNQLIAKEAGADIQTGDIIETLKEMFREFFPGKEFVGPTAHRDGRLEFRVQLSNGCTHDIDELSSGEKEVLLGYLRLRSDAPKNSVILIDEPELHLNPKMIHGLVSFYRRHIGEKLKNQLWLITHSDTLIRESIDEKDASCFHMRTSHMIDGDAAQLVKINARADVESVVIDLVGDLATYAPKSKVVLLEGGGDTEFDLKMVSLLFPELAEKVNIVSGQSKSKVRHLHELLDRVSEVALDVTFYSVVDRDFDTINAVEESLRFRRYSWDVYHIENYLLDNALLAETINAFEFVSHHTPETVESLLLECATEILEEISEQQMIRVVERELLQSLVTKPIPGNAPLHERFAEAAKVSSERIHRKLTDSLSILALKQQSEEIQEKFRKALQDKTWREVFPARPILRRLTAKLGSGIKYEFLRNVTLNNMKKNGMRPPGMMRIVEAILSR